jgi:hypothetical protein
LNPPRKRWRTGRWLLVALIPVGAAILYLMGRPPRRADVNAPLLDTLGILRVLADSCRADLEEGSSELNDYDRRLDSLRSRVRHLEAIDPRGIPADSYDLYMRVFDEYNDSVPGWTSRADSLRASWTRCRDLAETHNALADSLRRLLVKQLQDAQRNRRGR